MAATTYNTIVYIIILIIIGLTLPISGWLADVRYGWYKVIQWSMWTMWISLLLMTGSLVILQLFEPLNETAYKIVMICLIPLRISYGGFLANIIQFGVDQLSDAISCEIKTFVSWYSWTCVSS